MAPENPIQFYSDYFREVGKLQTIERVTSKLRHRYRNQRDESGGVDKRATAEIELTGNYNARIIALLRTINWSLSQEGTLLDRVLFEQPKEPKLPYGSILQKSDSSSVMVTGLPILFLPANPDQPPLLTPAKFLDAVASKLKKRNYLDPGKKFDEIQAEISNALSGQDDEGRTTVVFSLKNDLQLNAIIVNSETMVLSLGYGKDSYKRKEEEYHRSKPVKQIKKADMTPEGLGDIQDQATIYEGAVTKGLWPDDVAINKALQEKGWVPTSDETDAVLTELGLKEEVDSELVTIFRPENDTGTANLVIAVDKRGDKIKVSVHKSLVEAKAASERLDIKLLKDVYANFCQRLETAKELKKTRIMSPRVVLSEIFKKNEIRDPNHLSRLLPHAYRLLQLVVGSQRQYLVDRIQNQLNLYDTQKPPQILNAESYVNRTLAEDWQIWVESSAAEGNEDDAGKLPELQLYIRGMDPSSKQTSINLDEINRIIYKVTE